MKNDRKAKKDYILLDGAMGSFLKQNGMNDYKSIPELNIKNEDLIKRVHEEYVKSGSDVILTNSFSLNRINLKSNEHKLKTLIKASIELANKSKKNTLVAYDVGPLGVDMNDKFVDSKDVYETYYEIAKIIKNLDIDMIFIETMYQMQEALCALDAFKDTNKDIFLSFIFNEDNRLYSGETTKDIVRLLKDYKLKALGFNCVDVRSKALSLTKEFKTYSPFPIIAKPNLGIPKEKDNILTYGVLESEFIDEMESIYKAGAIYIGGCCGTNPIHIKLLKERLMDI
ncbi:homocysteine S-methyltransferase family protein [Clostridium algidicarnis]|uniref:homocysteine S-methyltransferase family protein n=1 Tax=Clostridium algidicarnis TaxID=37659 RepID=UPI001C0C42EA|nr:homocysteine S-methyltransferase family protein [Clostridium algidicarnis]MBU3209229.1 homocysteine S-methyltransferase family protein [Clostridium algidicarnis]